MNRKVLRSLVIVMGVVFLLLFGLQFFWILQAYKVKEKHFDKLAIRSLSEVSKTLETNETVVQINSEVFSIGELNKQDYFRYIDSISKKHNQAKFNFQNSFRKHTIIFPDTSINQSSDSLNSPLSKTEISSNQELNLSLLRNEISRKITKKTLFVEKVVNKLLNYNEDITSRIDTGKLKKLIAEKLADENIEIPFDFAIFQKDSLTPIRSSNMKNLKDSKLYKVHLFSNDVFNSGLVLQLNFPKRRHYLIHSILTITILSIVLVLAIFIIFSFNLYLILKQKRLSKIKADFINNITHELKTPISTITLASSLINEKLQDSDAKNLKKFTKIITDEAIRLNRQVENVLKIAIIEEGKVKLNKTDINLNSLIKRTVKNYQILFQQKKGEIEIDLENSIPVIDGNELHLTNILSNLLENALKYSKEIPIVKISTKSEHYSVKISVKDNGIGIEKKQLTKIFEKFYRVPTGNVHDVKGFGIGLSYVKDVVYEHEGKIFVNSELGKGTEFVITFPQKKLKNGRSKKS